MNPRLNPDFVGAGWAFPVTTDVTGGIALVAREREIEQSIRIILATVPGERPMRPEFGCRVHEHVFGPANGATAGQIAYAVREALERWEPRIVLQEVGVSFDQVDRGKLYVDVSYLVDGSNDPRNLVWPFYVIPDHDVAAADGGTAVTASPVPIGTGR
jgi:phage baseplate assembly protein W